MSGQLGPVLEDRGARCEHPVVSGTQEPGRKRLEARDWGQAAALVCWELAELRSGPGVGGLKWPGWNESPRPGCAAGAESAGSAADGPSSQRISTAPCGRTGGQPAAADAGIPTAQTKEYKMAKFFYCD